MSKLSVVKYGTFKLCDSEIIDFELDDNFGPFSSLAVYFINETLNLTAASKSFELNHLSNFVNI